MNIKVIASSSKGNCYVLEEGSRKIIIEAGINFRRIARAINFDYGTVDAVLISHEHKDHSKSVKDCLACGFPVYMSKGTMENISPYPMSAHVLEPGKFIVKGQWRIMPIQAEHDAAEPLLFIIVNGAEKILFATDTFMIRYRVDGLTRILIETNYNLPILRDNISHGLVPSPMAKRLLKSHLSFENAAAYLKTMDRSNLREIYCIHTSSGNSDSRIIKLYMERIFGVPVFICGEDGVENESL